MRRGDGSLLRQCGSRPVGCRGTGSCIEATGCLEKPAHVTPIENNEIVPAKGPANVNFGAPVGTMVALGGGKLVEAGYANECSAAQLAAITPRTRRLFSISNLTTVYRKSMLSVEQAAVVARTHNLPLIADAAAEEDFQKSTTAWALSFSLSIAARKRH